MSFSQRTAVLFLLAALAAVAVQAEPRLLVLDPAASKVSFTLPATGHDVEGALALKSGRIAFDSATGEASGEIAIDLVSAETGNRSRDNTMREDVLETGRWPLAVFRAEKIRGAIAPSGPSQVTLDGTLSLHGAEHKVSLPAKVETKNGHLKAETQLSVPFVDWGLHDPSIAFFRVAKTVAVKILAEGSVEATGAAEGKR